ncbi:Helix-turn-helix domain protein [compost metagenome]|uniref:helix-turn-helix domain-containing protein n=1 Tax=Aeromonas rivipollensis TaxID=948519 RepID=UPI000FC24830|nr:helix-turn-helix domain-containing protein [Aeromonas rivipollensis]NEX80450.1 helix-turn-helix domain-containing protein [Aeromonas rivipollensis]
MKYLTIDEVCEMLSVSRRTLERMRSPTSKSLQELMSETSFIDVDRFRPYSKERVYFPEPDFYIGKSPRWEMDKLLSWLSENGHRL